MSFLLAALLAAPPAAPGPWTLACYRGDQMGGHAFEICKARASFAGGPMALDRQAEGIILYLDDCPGRGVGSARLPARKLAKPDRAAQLAKAITATYAACQLPAPAIDMADLETLLTATDGLRAGWIPDPDLQRLRQPR